MKGAIEDEHKVTTEWEGKFYIGIALMWDYKKGMVQLFMAGYIRTSPHLFQHKNQKYHRIYHIPVPNPYM